MQPSRIDILSELEKKVLWLASWTIHNANHLRDSVDGLKVGGHQASSASLATIMTALYFDILRPQDRVAVKPHASPIFHAIQYLLGKQTREKLENFRGYKGAQSYPSRTKDIDDVDFSTGSVGLGVAQTLFSSIVQDYVRAHGLAKDKPEGRMIALVGDAELDEGNIFEALLEGWKQDLRNCWWIVDYNRQSLDAVVREGLWERYEQLFKNFGWDVVIVKYGALQEAAFREPGGEKLRAWIDACPNPLYSALVFQGGAAWRKRLLDEIGDQGDVTTLIEKRSDDELARLMNNLGGHDLPARAQGVPEHHARPAGLLHLLHGEGLRPADGRAQGQSRRADDAGADGDLPHAEPGAAGPRMGSLRRSDAAGRNAAGVSRQRAVCAAQARCESRAPRDSGDDIGAGAGRDLDPDRLRRADERDRQVEGAVCVAHRHHVAGRHGVDQSRRLGEPARPVRARLACWTPSATNASPRPSPGNSRRKASISSSASPR